MLSPNPMRWLVVKFGGTSVSAVECWRTIADILRERQEEGFRPLVVCSALAGVSNAIEEVLAAALEGQQAPLLATLRERHRALCKAAELTLPGSVQEEWEELTRLAQGVELVREISPRVQARALASGELMSSRMGVALLKDQGIDCDWFDARDGLHPCGEDRQEETRTYLSARCDSAADEDLQRRLEGVSAPVILTQGFIAGHPNGDTVVLGRGGSDTSAAYFAARLGACRCEIWTDVPGMFSANPHATPDARLLRTLDYDEAQEIASSGATVLHPRCLAPLRAHDIPLHVRCTQHPDWEGTVVSATGSDHGPRLKAIAARSNILLVSMETVGMWQQVGFLADVFDCFRRHQLSIDMVSTSETNVTVSLDPAANSLPARKLEALLADLSRHCRARVIGPCAAVSLLGRNVRAILHQLGPALEVFEEQKIHMVSQAASDLNLTFVVEEGQAERLVRELHGILVEQREGDALLGPSWRELHAEEAAAPRRARREWWRERADELLALSQEESPLYVYDLETVDRAAAALSELEPVSRVFYAVKANAHPDILRLLASRGLGFECVSPDELRHVRETVPDLDGERLLFTPNFAPAVEYQEAFAADAIVTLDNLHPLRHWPALFHGREVMVRLDPGRGRGHHAYVRTAGAQSKFGIASDQLDELCELLEVAEVRVRGLHAHAGSGIRRAESWKETALFLAEAARRFQGVKVLNLGGGLGVPEKADQEELDLGRLAEHLGQARSAHPEFELWLEPGRFLVAEAGVLLARVTQVKAKGERRYVGIETGMNSLIRPALYGAYHEIVNLSRLGQPTRITCDVVGPICETGDTLGHARPLPETDEGDVLLIADVGAYGRTMASHYNRRAPAVERVLPSRR